MKITVNIDAANRDLSKLGVNVEKALSKLIVRLVLKGEGFMKRGDVTPYRTGTLRRGIHGYPTVRPTGIATNVNYAFIANVTSRRPGFIEKTSDYVIDLIPEETQKVIKNILKRLS
jgi:hypothetical protein